MDFALFISADINLTFLYILVNIAAIFIKHENPKD